MGCVWPDAEVATENRDAFVDAETGTGDEVPEGEEELYMDSRVTLGGWDPIILLANVQYKGDADDESDLLRRGRVKEVDLDASNRVFRLMWNVILIDVSQDPMTGGSAF